MSFETAPMTFQALQNLKSGRAVFTMPTGNIKCPGAGQKACYLSEDYLRREGRRPAVDVTFCVPGEKILAIPRYMPTIESLVQDRGINVKLGNHLVEVRGKQQEAVFEKMSERQPTGEYEVMKYDLLHVTPPQGPVEEVASSSLSNADGYVSVDKETLQHTRYPNVFGIGDCISAPTSRTAAAAAAQFLVLRENLDALMAGRTPNQAKYDGYSSCPLVTREGAVVMMEFGYDGSILETFTPFGIDQSKEQYPMWLVKTEALPWAYWNLMVKGYVPWVDYRNMLARVAKVARQCRDRPAAA